MQGNIARWLKKEGDKISAGEVLCEVETVGFLYTESVGWIPSINRAPWLCALHVWKADIYFHQIWIYRIKQQLRWNAWKKDILLR